MAFWKPGTVAPGSNELKKPTKESDSLLVDREAEKETDVPVYNPLAAYSIQQQRVKLPIFKCKNEILYLIEKYPVVIIVGETGCGKTTQVPQYLYEGGWAKSGTKTIACTQPRRVAATSVAIRVAQEMGVPLGAEVGYSIRFDDRCDPNRTVIKYMTDGMLIREMMLDPLLSHYSVIMLDEAHERSLYTDILLGLLKKIQRKRKDLRLVVSSATIDAEDVKNFFGGNDEEHCYIMSIEGRTFPVDIHYLMKPTNDYLQCALRTVLDIHKFQPEGDILVFLTGQEEIDTLVQMIKDRASDPSLKGTDRLRVLPMYSGLPYDQVMMVFESAPPHTRKVIVATNIAETSVTIDGIVYVVDSGFVKIRAYNPRLGIETLMVTPISQATAKQRAGRAGRNRPGKCYRLYSEEDMNKLIPLPVPEMQRTNLATVVLQLKSLGIDNVLYFDFMSPPPVDNIIRALEILYSLGALDNDCKLTDPIGNTIAEFPLEPFMARMLISAGHEYKCSEEILTIASLLSVQSIFKYSPDQKHAVDQARRKFAVYEGDHLTLLNVYNAFIRAKKSPDWCRHFHLNYKALVKAGEIRNQLKKYMKRWRIPLVSAEKDSERILKAIVCGFFAQAAHLQPDGTYKPVRGGPSMVIHPVSVLTNRNPEWVIYHEVVQTTVDRIHMREVTEVDPTWLAQIAPHFYEFSIKAVQHTEQMQVEIDTNKYRSVF